MEKEMPRLLTSTALCIVVASAGHAVTVEGFTDADWTEVVDANDENRSTERITNDDNVLEWGFRDRPRVDRPGSTLTFLDGAFSGSAPVGSVSPVSVFSIEWENLSTAGFRTEDEFTALGEATINWTMPLPGTGPLTESLSFAIKNTGNPDGDEITPSMATLAVDFNAPTPIGGQSTVLSYQWILSSVGDVENEGGATLIDGLWFNPEGNTSVLTLQASVETVPLPAAGWMLLAGVGGLVAMKRRRKAEVAA